MTDLRLPLPADRDAACLVPAETKIIGGRRFAKWKRKIPGSEFSLSWRTVAIALLVGLALIGSARVAVDAMQQGIFWPGTVWSIALPVVLYGGYGWPALCRVIELKRSKGLEPAVHRRFPRAHLVRAIVRGDSGGGSSEGWLWVEGGRLRFRGDNFDFDLVAGDFERPEAAIQGLNFRARGFLNLPKGLSRKSLVIRPLVQDDQGRRYERPDLTQKLIPELEAWAKGAVSGESTLPPMRSPYLHPPLFSTLLRYIPAALAVGTLFASVPLLFPEYAVGRMAPTMFAIGVGMALSFPFLINMSAAAESEDRQIEKVLAEERKGRALPSE